MTDLDSSIARHPAGKGRHRSTKPKRDYDRKRNRAVWRASQKLRDRHRAEYAQLLTAELAAEGIA